MVKARVTLRIVTDQVRGALGAVAQKFPNSHTLELRSSPDVHDRHIFVDQRGWIVGQSIKDAARKKPTYLVELSSGRFQPFTVSMSRCGTAQQLWSKVRRPERKGTVTACDQCGKPAIYNVDGHPICVDCNLKI